MTTMNEVEAELDKTRRSAVAIFSGGLDSTTMVYEAQKSGIEITQLLSFNYGQRHKKELEFAQLTAEKLHLPWTCIDLWSSGLTELLSISGSSLVSKEPVPEGHYAADNMKATVVPNRNMIMLAIAGGVAVAQDANYIMTGVHAGDHFIYPDCRPEFIGDLSYALRSGNEGFGSLNDNMPIYAPYLYVSKADIARRAIELGVPLHETWSCYQGGLNHCGKCGTCVERLEAIDTAAKAMGFTGQVEIDLTTYDDPNFWKEAVANA